jgi:RHH-type proline utilization regulon transcriptional repressor/proline dehydrogenase/delta 1-pyrroline-5-carboxylate dehydrogenase
MIFTTEIDICEIATCDVVFQLALLEGQQGSSIKPALARRQGPLVSSLDTTEDHAIPLWRLVAERSLSINTTAAGGNASLMMLSDSLSDSDSEPVA